VYSSAHPLMRIGNACPPEHFEGGITNGAHWYEVKGVCLYSLHMYEYYKG
jgi:carboxypeptidase D